MAAYIVIRINVTDAEKLKAYQQVTTAIIAKYDGRILARGGEVVSLEGPEESRRIVMIEFPSLERAKAFYDSDEYRSAIELRQGAADFELIAIEGIA